MSKIIIERMDAEEFLEMLRETRESLERPEWRTPAKAIQNIMEDFNDLCGGDLEPKDCEEE